MGGLWPVSRGGDYAAKGQSLRGTRVWFKRSNACTAGLGAKGKLLRARVRRGTRPDAVLGAQLRGGMLTGVSAGGVIDSRGRVAESGRGMAHVTLKIGHCDYLWVVQAAQQHLSRNNAVRSDEAASDGG
jgi:hypothetical protein